MGTFLPSHKLPLSPPHAPPPGRSAVQVFCRQATRTGADVRSNGRSASAGRSSSAARENGRPGNGSASSSAAAGNGRPASRSASRGRGRGAELNGAGNGNGRSVSPINLREPEDASDPAENPRINLIERSRWEDGVPPVMGAHLMPSGIVAPISMTKGPGIGDGHLFFYPDEKKQQVVTQYLNANAGGDALAKQIHEIARKAVATKGGFTLAVSGGSLLTALEHLAGDEGARFDKWHVVYVDERNVPHASDDSNHRGARKAFLSKIDVPRSQVYAIKEGLGVAEAAKQYEGQLLGIPVKVLPRTPDGFPVFDVVLLGVGPDGHVASLFPNRKETAAKKGWILPVSNSPKPPPERITFSMPVINSAKHVYVVAFGKGKAEIVQRALEVQSLPGALPVQLVNPASGSLQWMLDCEAASQLNITKWENARDFPRSERE